MLSIAGPRSRALVTINQRQMMRCWVSYFLSNENAFLYSASHSKQCQLCRIFHLYVSQIPNENKNLY